MGHREYFANEMKLLSYGLRDLILGSSVFSADELGNVHQRGWILLLGTAVTVAAVVIILFRRRKHGRPDRDGK